MLPISSYAFVLPWLFTDQINKIVMQQDNVKKSNGALLPPRNSNIKIILFAGFLVGSLDILSAFVDYYIQTGKGPEGVLKFVASGVFGQSAFSGGAMMIFSGLLFHYIIAFCFTIFFIWLYPRLPFLSKNIIVTAVMYGLFVWLLMNLVVVPLSNVPKTPFPFFKIVKGLLILICLIGLPLAV